MTPEDNAFRYTVEGDLKYSVTFWFWWHYAELRARLTEARSLFKRGTS